MSAPAVDHAVELDEQTRAELQPPCDVTAPEMCGQAAAWVLIVLDRHECLLGNEVLLCEAHAARFMQCAYCSFCGALVRVSWERL